MDRDPAFAAGRHGCDAGGDAARDRRGVAAGATRFLGQTGHRCAGLPAAGAAAGRHRLSAAADLRQARPRRRVARGPSRHRVRVSLDRRGAGLRHHVVSAPGAADPAVDRSSGPAAGASGGDAGRGALAGVPDRHPAAGAAGRAGRNGAGLCESDRRIRRDHYLRVEYTRRNPDHFVGDLFADPDAGWRCRGAAAGGGFDCDRDGRHDRLRMVCAARLAAPARKLTMLRIDVAKLLGEFSLQASFANEGRVTGLFGASGAGKTSLINMIAGLLRPDRGSIAVDDETLDDTAAGVHVPAHRRRIGYVFQDARLFPHLDVRQNLDYGRRMNRLADDHAQRARVTDLLDIGGLLNRRPGKLSGGERQRVALGRALLSKPRLLLLDEPLASLDAARKREILPYLVRLRDEAKVPMLYVSHQFREVRRIATQVVRIEDGSVAAQGGLDLLDASVADMLHDG